MIIAVSMRVVANSTYPEQRDAISHDWVSFLEQVSVTPVFVPNTLRDPSAYMDRVGARGLILTGGDDLGKLPGEPHTVSPPSERDLTERALLSHAISQDLPVLGVCRGLQVINVFFGGALDRDLSSLGRHVNTTHPVDIVSAPSESINQVGEAVTNSYHNQGVLSSGLAPELKAFALASGNLVEGLYHPERDIVAIQWHPERPNPAADLDRALFQDWLARCG
jgi:putative glutamine amidotransferase